MRALIALFICLLASDAFALRRPVDSPMRKMRAEHLLLLGDGSLLQGNSRASVSRDATGAYTITLTESYGRDPMIWAQHLSDTATTYLRVDPLLLEETGFTVTSQEEDGLGSDATMMLLILGSEIADEQ